MAQLYSLTIGRRSRSRLFRTENVYVTVDFHHDWSRISPQDVPRQLFFTFKKIIKEIADRVESSPTDYLRFAVHHPGLKTPAFIPFKQYKDVSALQLLNKVATILQSNEEFRLDERMSLEVCHVSPPNGEGSGIAKKRNVGDFGEYLKKKRCLVAIKNHDDLCFQRAIVVAKHYASKEDTKEWEAKREKLRRTGPNSFQTRKTHLFIEKVGGRMEACRGKEDWDLYGRALGKEGFQLNIYAQQLFGKAAYRSHKYVEGTPKHLNLYVHGQHYDVISNIGAFVERSYFCETCQVGYNNASDHKCHVMCQKCRQSGPACTGDLDLLCPDCHRLFHSQSCFDRHKTPHTTVSVCERWKRCLKCGKEWDTIKMHRPLDQHVCGEYQCKICQVFHTKADRWCYIQKVKCPIDINGNKEDQITALQIKDLTRFVFFDFECQQDSGEHIPNLCVLQLCCHFCINDNKSCQYCDSYWNQQKEVVMEGPNTLDQVGQWFIRLAGRRMVEGGTENNNVKSSKQVICVAHNFKGYDGILMMQAIHKHAVAAPEIIMTGGKVMAISMGCVKFIDSLNYLSMPLRNMPATFGLTEMKKGYFPHFFNTPENNGYIGAYPPQEAYDPDGMNVKEREKFLKWYEERKDTTFDFNQEILAYCQSDVDILRRSCGAFRHIFLNDTGIDPLATSMTLPAACNRVYRMHYLPVDTIPIIPRALMQSPGKGEDWRRYQPRQQSNKALRWLEWEQHRRTITAFQDGSSLPNIRHAANGGEIKVGPYSLDGMDQDLNVAYEFFGCAFHGCPTCYPGPVQDVKHFHPYDPTRTMRELHDKTMQRLHDLKNKYGLWNIVTVWECQVEKERRANDDMEEFFRALETNGWPNPEPLLPRDAFFGGRTNAIQLMAVPKEPEEIRYLDVVSLYPYICKYGQFPIQEPEIITQPDQVNWQQYEGLIQCKVLPPRQLYHPVLPLRWNKKTTFPLCRSCLAENMQDSEIAEYVSCSHSDEERAWVGTYVSLELKKAASLGYIITKVFEVWHWSEDKWSQYDTLTKTGGLFAGYIDHYLKTKMESSGYPSECRTDEEKNKFIADVYRKEGIRLDPANVVHNNGVRNSSKLKLNVLWGKFGQRDNFSQTEYVTEPSRYFELLTDVTESIKDVQLVNDDMVMVERLKLEEHVQPSPITNVVIAAFVTAQARLKLYSVLEPLGERVCYFDTDSVIYVHHPEKWNPPRGNSLGEWKDELEENVTITEFVSGGAKNYAYELSDGQTVCKVRGFTLNYRGSQNLNFDSMKGMVENVHQSAPLTITNPFKITRTRDRRLYTKPEDKQYKVVYTKRFVQFNEKDEPINTYPYGY